MLRKITFNSLILVSSFALAQVQVILPSKFFKPEEKIEAYIKNIGKDSVSVCVEFGQWSPHNGTIETTPSPFYVEKKDHGNWNVLLIGPDIGSLRRPVTIEAGETQDFPFRLNTKGKMRLLLNYWSGEREDVCNEKTANKKTALSQQFFIRD